MLTLAPVVVQAIQLGITLAPDIIRAVKYEIALINSKAVPSAEQQARIDAALEAAHAALQQA